MDNGNFLAIQSNVCDAVDGFRDNILYDHFVWNGHRYDSDPTSMTNITGTCTFILQNGGQVPPGFAWRDYDNINVPVTGSDMQAIGNALMAFTFTCYQVDWYHKANVMALTDVNAILSYNYQVGWPNVTLSYPISGVAMGPPGFFQVATDLTAQLTTTPYFNISGSSGNDGPYTVTSVSYDNNSPGTTTIFVVQEIPNAVVGGNLILP